MEKCRPRHLDLLRALFEHGVIQLTSTSSLWGVSRLDNARIPNTAFDDPDLVSLASGQPFACITMHTPVCVGDWLASREILALDSVEAWGSPACLGQGKKGPVASWSEVLFPVLAVVLVGWNQALNVCQWVQEHSAERVTGVGPTNRFSDFTLLSRSPIVPKSTWTICVACLRKIARLV